LQKVISSAREKLSSGRKERGEKGGRSPKEGDAWDVGRGFDDYERKRAWT